MAEFCLECYKEYIDPNARNEHLVLSMEDDLELCGFCGEYKRNVIASRKNYPFPVKYFEKNCASVKTSK